MSKFLKYGVYMCLKVVFTWQKVPTIMKCNIVPNHAGTEDMWLYFAFYLVFTVFPKYMYVCMFVCLFPVQKRVKLMVLSLLQM